MIGYHINREFCRGNASIEQHIEKAKKAIHPCSVCQIFISGPDTCNLLIDTDGIKTLKVYMNTRVTEIIVHGSYLSHLFNDNSYCKNLVSRDISVCESSGIRFYLLHMANVPIIKYIQALERVTNPNVCILLETNASKPISSLYSSAESIVELYNNLYRQFNIGICIDTAHIHASGIDISSYEKAQKYFNTIIENIPSEKIAIHLNDDYNTFGSGKDNHAVIFDGTIWKMYKKDKKNSGIYFILKFIQQYKIKTILEKYPNDVIRDYKVIHSLI
jgi:endonuclease IV